MAIIRDEESKFTAELTDIDMVMWLCLHNNMEMQEAYDQVKASKGKQFFVRLPDYVKTTNDLITHTRQI